MSNFQDGKTCIHDRNIEQCPLCDFYQAHQFGFSKKTHQRFVQLRMELFDNSVQHKDEVIEKIIDLAYERVFEDGESSTTQEQSKNTNCLYKGSSVANPVNGDVEPSKTIEPDAYSFVIEDAALDPVENHRTLAWSDPEDRTTIPGIRHADHQIKEKQLLYNSKTIREAIDRLEQDMKIDLEDENTKNWNATVSKFADKLRERFTE